MISIKENAVVAFRYIMKNGRGEVLENSMDGVPTIYLHGCDGILRHLQDQMHGLVAGEKKVIHLETDDAYSFEVIIDEVRDATQAEITLGYPVQVSAERCEEDCACYER